MAVSLRPGPPLRIVTPRMTPAVRRFIANEAGSAAVLLAATVIALVWANSLWGHTYEDFWQAPFTIEVGTSGLHLDLRHFVNDAGMAVFFLVLGLEIAREMTAGELRDHGLLTVPAFGALGGMLVPIAIFLAINPSGPASHGWGVVMSSDTAFVLGVLALFGPRCPDQLRLFLLALAVVDDIGAISVMAVFYSEHVQVMPADPGRRARGRVPAAELARSLAADAVRAAHRRAVVGDLCLRGAPDAGRRRRRAADPGPGPRRAARA
jgi:Na+:H+ antiporter, NhaA family